MKKTLILSALMAAAVTLMSCTTDTDDGISPAVLVSLQQQEAQQALYKKNERVSGTWTYEYEAPFVSDNVNHKYKFNLTLNPNGTGTCTVTFTPHIINVMSVKEMDSDSYSIQNYTYDETKGLTITDRIDFDGLNLHRTSVGTIEIKELTDTTMKLYVPKLTTSEEQNSDLRWIKMQMFSIVCESSFPEITTWTKQQ
ncbi:MAG: hypothetical protein II098_09620 [Treponema sp.]|nr:hypothetical protein [Treponema sp.]